MYQFARSAVTEEIKVKFIEMIEHSSEKHELLAEDIIEIITVTQNDPEGF
ncbi:conserved hypothetical protein [Xenorhabdus cabanillasii JM26]|uniref:Uncharacterized protein n=1 Tax=Xenorhabdus cabanillasii JM26 TaxID=1427517 RepID=W1IQS1_9GAMM|nr:hypothetical protein [Xenorhabdus cabanillasii]CDL79956.1 conserved hypothetical protein [Xenorhabdus cabanillasii JM26]